MVVIISKKMKISRVLPIMGQLFSLELMNKQQLNMYYPQSIQNWLQMLQSRHDKMTLKPLPLPSDFIKGGIKWLIPFSRIKAKVIWLIYSS